VLILTVVFLPSLESSQPSWVDPDNGTIVLGIFGDASPTTPTDWLPLDLTSSDRDLTPASTLRPLVACPNLPRAWELRVVIAPQGLTVQPQWRVVGAELRPITAPWALVTNLSHVADTDGAFPVAYTVSFARVDDLTLQGRRRTPPAVHPRCRHTLCAAEWFYPLSHAAAGYDDRTRQYTVACAMFMALAGLFVALGTCVHTPSRDLHGV
jgi:hypothetical protein